MKSFFLKLFLIAAAVLTVQVLISALYPPELPAEILRLEQHLQSGDDIIFLGDSTLIYPTGEVTTGEILQEFLPEQTIGQVAHPAYNLDLYRHYVDYITTFDPQPETVIIPINLRSFSPEWDRRPAYQFQVEKSVLRYGPLLSTIFYRPLDTFGGFDAPIRGDAFFDTPVFSGTTVIGQVADFEERLGNDPVDAQALDVTSAYNRGLPDGNEEETLETQLIYYYMGALSPGHRKIQSLLETGRQLKAAGIQPIFYITPINYQLGERFLGETFTRRVAENVARVNRVLRGEDIELLDLTFTLDAYFFVDTEHLTENGKAQVAEALAARIEPPVPGPVTSASPEPPDTPTASSQIAVVAQPTEPPATQSSEPAGDQPDPTVAQTTATSTPLPPSPTPSPSPPPPTIPTPSAPPANPAEPTATPPPAPAVNPTPTPLPPTPTNTRVVPLAFDQAAGQGQIVSAEFYYDFQPAGNYDVDLYQIRYRTLTDDDRPVEVRAYLYVPLSDEPERLPVMGYSGGTTGIGPDCAPLDEISLGQAWGAHHYQMLDYAAQGFVVVWPNGQGFEDDQPANPYFMAENQGRTLLDAARAVYDFFDEQPPANSAVRPMEAVFFGGYSSGGHAAFAARDLAVPYAPELPVKGVLGHGPTTNPETLIKENPIFSPYLVSAYQTFFGGDVVNPSRVFQDNYLASFNADSMTRCVDDLYGYYSPNARLIYREEFREALYNDRLQTILPAFKRRLDANAAGLSRDGATIPALILQGTGDRVVTPPSQAQFARSLCGLGGRVTYLTYPAVDHAGTRYASFRDTIDWMKTVAAGGVPESTCDSLPG